MTEAVLTALISAVASVIAILITGLINNRKIMAELKANSEINDTKLEAKFEKFEAVSNTKIDELTREVRLHNNFAQKIPLLEQKIDFLEKAYYKGDKNG